MSRQSVPPYAWPHRKPLRHAIVQLPLVQNLMLSLSQTFSVSATSYDPEILRAVAALQPASTLLVIQLKPHVMAIVYLIYVAATDMYRPLAFGLEAVKYTYVP